MLVEDLSRNKCCFQVRISHVLRFISISDLFTDFPSYVHICDRSYIAMKGSLHVLCRSLKITFIWDGPGHQCAETED
jgi:hypothetical protein